MIEAAVQPSDFTADFTIKITGLKVTNTINSADVVKQVEWTLIGKESGCSFELSQSTQLDDPDDQNFIPFVSLTEAEIVTWIENTETRLLGIKAHIQYVLDREVAKADLSEAKLPWATEEQPVGPAKDPTVA